MIGKNLLLLILVLTCSSSLWSLSYAFVTPHIYNKYSILVKTLRSVTPVTQLIENEYYMPPSILPSLENQIAISTQRLSRMDLIKAINDVKRFVEARFESDLNLVKHPTPLAFMRGTGVNDELDGTESKSAVRFTVPNEDIPRGIQVTPSSMKFKYEIECEIVQSLAKWKRIILKRLGCPVGQGIYCDSSSIRKGYKGDVTHSVVADQWDFEIRITREQRNLKTLMNFVTTIYKIITDAQDFILEKYPDILLEGHPTSTVRLPKKITFITAQELHNEFPNLSIHERENAAVAKYGAIFIIGMGWPMDDGSPAEEMRSPGYDDWNLNGDIMVQHPLTGYRHELSSMGIRIDREALLKQLEHRGMSCDKDLDFYKAAIDEELPFSYGGGLGISRLLMLLLRTGHIGEVQVGVWHDDHYKQAMDAGIDMIPDRVVKIKDHKNDGGFMP